MPDYESERDVLGFTFEDYEDSRQSRALRKASRRRAPIHQLLERIVRRIREGSDSRGRGARLGRRIQ
jgi:hypothetical protein